MDPSRGAGNATVPPDSGERDLIEQVGQHLDQFETRLIESLLSAPHLGSDLVETLHMLPNVSDAPLASLAGLFLVGVYGVVFLLSRRRRLSAATARVPVLAMLRLTAWSLLPLLTTAVAARILLVHGSTATAPESGLMRQIVLGVIVWLASITFLDFVVRPGIPHLRLVPLNEKGARNAFRWGAVLLGLAQIQAAALEAAGHAGMPRSSLTLLAGLAAAVLLILVLRLLARLRVSGLPPHLHMCLVWLVILGVVLWLWGWLMQSMALYQGMKTLVIGMLAALAFDRSIALSISLSRRPAVMRLLFVIRILVNALAIAIIVRVIAGYWLVGNLSLIDPADWPDYSRRLNFALVLMVCAASLAALIHAAIEARIMPQEALGTLEDQELRQARVSTVLPIIRVSLIMLIGGVFSLVALSALGIDTTPVMAGAGILGLAVSLGSQALVKDIISGVFWMLDDAFRLGEDVEIDGKPGRIERIQIRSLRLRTSDGQLQTIPYGQIEIVASRSRSLTTARITIRLTESPSTVEQDRLLRLVGSTLRSEPVIQTAIVGKIALAEIVTGHNAHELGLTFHLLRVSAPSVLPLIPGLLLEVLQSAGVALASDSVEVSMLEATPAPTVEAPAQIAASTP